MSTFKSCDVFPGGPFYRWGISTATNLITAVGLIITINIIISPHLQFIMLKRSPFAVWCLQIGLNLF